MSRDFSQQLARCRDELREAIALFTDEREVAEEAGVPAAIVAERERVKRENLATIAEMREEYEGDAANLRAERDAARREVEDAERDLDVVRRVYAIVARREKRKKPLIEALLLADRQTLPEHIAKLVDGYARGLESTR